MSFDDNALFRHADIKALRDECGYSQRELAERMRTAQSVVARLEGGRSSPSLSTLARVAEALGLEIEVRFREPIEAPEA